MPNFTLTAGPDTVLGGAADDTVYGTAATLNAGDSLTGGAGTDVLALVGSGTFRVDQLASFSGFEHIRLDNATSSYANLTLGTQPIEVDATGYLSIQANSPSNWNGSNIINGDTSHTWTTTSLNFYNQGVYPPLPVTYDLTSNTLSHVNISVGTNDVTLLINNADTAGVQSFSGYGQNDKLAAAGSTLDLSHTTVAGLWVTSTNALGTAFTVGDLGTAFQIAGGAGLDTIVATGFTFTADQRNAIFATASVEKIVDPSGTYTADIAPTITSNGGGDTATLSIAENATAVTTVTATDPDAGQTLTYSITGGADAGKFTIGSTTGALSFITAPNFELPTDAGGNNVYDVTVQVSDGNGGIDIQAIAVTVNDVVENTTVIEANGSTRLTEVGDHFFLYDSGGSGPSLKYAGADFVAGSSPWAPIGAEQTANGYEVAWKLTGTDQYTVWNTDSSGNYTSSKTGVVSGADYALQSLEPSFHQDLNHDGQIGPPTTVIEANGSTRLTEVGDHFFLYDSGGSGPSLKYAGADFVAGSSPWAPIGAEQTANGYEVAWKLTGTDQYTVWNTDSSGNYTSSKTGVVSGADYALQSLEPSFHQDLNHDGQIGPPTTVIEANGSTRLTEVGDHFFLYDSGGSGPSLKYAGADFVAGSSPWAPIGAEQTANGYEVAWKLTGTDQYTVWNTDSSGNYTSSKTGVVSGADYALQSLEPSFHQDLNHDGQIGPPTTVMDGHLGAQTLTAGGDPTTLIGGPNDILNAGAGADTFVFRPDFGLNTINGFAGGTDAIQFDHTIFADVADVQSHMQQIGSDVVIAHDPQNVVTLHDILLANLHMSDFHIV